MGKYSKILVRAVRACDWPRAAYGGAWAGGRRGAAASATHHARGMGHDAGGCSRAPEEWLHPHLARPHGPLTSLHAAQREREHAQELIRRELESHARPSPSLEPHVPRGLRARHLREHERIKEACDEPHMRGLGLF